MVNYTIGWIQTKLSMRVKRFSFSVAQQGEIFIVLTLVRPSWHKALPVLRISKILCNAETQQHPAGSLLALNGLTQLIICTCHLHEINYNMVRLGKQER